MKKTYSTPQMQVIEVKQADIIATSSPIMIDQGDDPWDSTNKNW